MKDAFKYLSGSVVVYVVMAACAGSVDPPPRESMGTAGQSAGRSGMMASSGRSGSNGGAGPNGGEPSLGGMMGMAGDTDPSGDGGDGPRDAGMMDALADAMTNPVPDADASTSSGTRLKRRYWVGEDGSREPVGEPMYPDYGGAAWYSPADFSWYDSERDENCRFRVAADGVVRCLPASVEMGSAFADDECTVPIIVVSTPARGETARYGHRYSASMGLRMFALGAALGTTTYYDEGGDCAADTAFDDQTLYATGAEIPPTAFVGFTIEVEQ
jgi:hypothetical protein